MNESLIESMDINIGLIGLGYVGTGVFNLIQHQKEYISKKIGKDLKIVAVAEKNIGAKKDYIEKYKDIKFTENAYELINDESIDIIVELIGGIDPAYEFITSSLKNGKYIVTANTNFIQTKMKDENLSFEKALKIAQDLGYAETNPASDIEGKDSANKLAILASIAFNSRVHYDDVYREGIGKITSFDIQYADEIGYAIKLLAIGSEENGRINVRVHPSLIPKSHILASIKDTYNAVYFYGNYVGEIMSFGKGAGDKPTASSVVGDIISIARNYDRNHKKKIFGCTCFAHKPIMSFNETTNKFYMLIDVVAS